MAVENELSSYIPVHKTTYQGYEGLSDMTAINSPEMPTKDFW
jgi:hypothetical protein